MSEYETVNEILNEEIIKKQSKIIHDRDHELCTFYKYRNKILDLVAEQADDDGLWFDAPTITESYLQQELRKLHTAIEKEYKE